MGLKSIVSRYRCPKCNIFNSINVNRIFDGRMLFSCSECNICAVVLKYADVDGPDSAYLEFLDLYDNGHVANSDDLKVTMQQERILRPPQEIDKLLEINKYGSNNKLLRKILHSQQDYVVEYRLIQDSNSGIGCPVSKLSIDDRLVSILSKKGVKQIYEFQEESINKILLGEDVVLVAPTASGKTEAFCIPILQKISEYLQSSCSESNQIRPIKGQIYAIFCILRKHSQEINFLK
jgi:DEAD/DEAH box helicase domain-containing protein